jgi:hypothetical protein
MNLNDHPALKKIQAEVDAENLRLEQKRIEDQAEAARLRQERGQLLGREYTARIQEYEVLRKQIHAKLGEVWTAVQEYSRLTGATPSTFQEATFMKIDVPSLVPNPSPFFMSSNHSTTRAGVDSWFSTQGKTWI